MVNHIYNAETASTFCRDWMGRTAISMSGGPPSCPGCIEQCFKDGANEARENAREAFNEWREGDNGIEMPLNLVQEGIRDMMISRHRKYGAGNIAEFGPFGILVRMSDKFARLKAGHDNFDDETVENTLDDVIGYALIWKLWLRGSWPGSEKV